MHQDSAELAELDLLGDLAVLADSRALCLRARRQQQHLRHRRLTRRKKLVQQTSMPQEARRVARLQEAAMAEPQAPVHSEARVAAETPWVAKSSRPRVRDLLRRRLYLRHRRQPWWSQRAGPQRLRPIPIRSHFRSPIRCLSQNQPRIPSPTLRTLKRSPAPRLTTLHRHQTTNHHRQGTIRLQRLDYRQMLRRGRVASGKGPGQA
ncbi:hypothetical protein AWC12_26250 [Mycolicibacterium iranicum]|uniref:Uncharacterized protein n=1 Tax=Mycolicibacterium iranicum TaxID=912594 RepID=A0A1X1WA68_MYCIR|nr:hypothetical protein AWC12_26250 [Mycolicibacterium iranicum]